MIHELKILPEYFKPVLLGIKTFEVRKNDRGYKIGDTLLLKEFNPIKKKYTGLNIQRKVVYIFNGGNYGLAPEFVILGIK